MGTVSFPWTKTGQGVTLFPQLLLVPWSRKGTAIPLLPRMRRMAYTEPQCLYKGALYLFYMDSHSDVNKLQPEDTYRCWGMT